MPNDRPLRIGLIGSGSIARQHLKGFKQFPAAVQAAGVFNPHAKAAQAFSAAAGGIPVFSSAAELVEHDDIDAVDICTPHNAHTSLAIAAAEAGKHVLLEKPMAPSIPECRDIIAACDRGGVTLMVAQHLRYLPSYQGVKQLVNQGALGRVWAGRIHELLPFDIVRQPLTRDRWYNDGIRAGGGVVITQSVHHIDLFRYFFGNVRRVSASYWTDNPAYTNGAEDSATATLEFENGMVVQLCASNSTSAQHLFQFSIYGTAGTVQTQAPEGGDGLQQHQAPAFASLHADAASDTGRFSPGAFQPVPPPDEPLPSDNPFANEVAHFAQCCRDHTQPISNGHDNLETMKAVLAIYASAKSGGEWVELSTL